MSLGLPLPEVTLALGQGSLLCVTQWQPGEMGGARWRRMARSPDAVASLGVAEVCSGAGWRPGSQDGYGWVLVGTAGWPWLTQGRSHGGDRPTVFPAGSSSSMCGTQSCRQLICTSFISKAQKCVKSKPLPFLQLSGSSWKTITQDAN